MKIDRDAPVGVFDSGIGGLTVAREIMRNLPSEKSYISGTPPVFHMEANPKRLLFAIPARSSVFWKSSR